jgi:hypothetical protein
MKFKNTSLLILLGSMNLAVAADSALPTKPVEAAFAPITDDPRLPRVLLIGDSVSIGYTLAVRQELAGTANVHRPPANCGSTKIGLRDLERWLGEKRWDVIHFNFGLHDLGYRWPEDTNLNAQGIYATPKNGGHQNVPPETYAKNLRTLVARLKRSGAKLIFATTTPVSADLHSYVKAAEQPYNVAALQVMAAEKIVVNDLWAFAMPQIESLQILGNPHFTAKGSAALARQVALSVRAQLTVTPADFDLGVRVQPVPLTARFSDPDWHIWCGAPIRGDDGKYHLLYSRWPARFGFAPGWALHSEIAYAVADQPLGPYKFVNVALPARGVNPATGKKFWDGDVTHNPNLLRHPNGKYYLFYMGEYGDGQDYPMHRNHQRIGVAIADSPAGPWQRFDDPIVDVSADPTAFDSLCVTNPAAAVRPDGGILLIYKAVQIIAGKPMGGNVRYGAAIAATPEGPYVKTPGRIFEPESTSTTQHWMFAEDPFVWFSRTAGNCYYAVARDVVGEFTGAKGGLALFQSADGLKWRAANHPKVLGAKFTWADGSLSKTQVERPALLFDEHGQPIALFGATDGYRKDGQTSFNVHLPLMQPE